MLSLNCGLENPSDKQFWQRQIDQVVAKSVTTTNNKTTNSTLVNPKPCRYGIHCARPGCRFKHSSDTNKAVIITFFAFLEVLFLALISTNHFLVLHIYYNFPS